MVLVDSRAVEQEDGLSLRYTSSAISSVLHAIHFTIYASRVPRTPLATFFNSLLGLP